MSAVRLTIGIATRNRPEALRRCLRSLSVIAHLAPEILVFDDASAVPVHEGLTSSDLPLPVRFIRHDTTCGVVAGRNQLVREASAPSVLLMDDDAAIRGAEAIEQALQVIEADRELAAIAFAQCDINGARWDDSLQPGRSRVPCYVAAFIGSAHMVRRDVFNAIGGYRESFGIVGE